MSKNDNEEVISNYKVTGGFACESCNFTCRKRSDFIRHLSTRKHKFLKSGKPLTVDKPKTYSCECGKKYKHRSTLSVHRKNCPGVLQVEPQSSDSDDVKSMFMQVMTKFQEVMQVHIEERKVMHEWCENTNHLINKITEKLNITKEMSE